MITTTDLNSPEGVLSELLTGAVEVLDIAPEFEAHARERYRDIGRHLNQHGDAQGGAEWNVYAQGSFLLGTVVRPVAAEGEYDTDLVCVRMIKKESTTQAELKYTVGQALEGYVRSADGLALSESGRCWTLREPAWHFHADVLPSIPDIDGSATGILLTDRDFARWLKSDPLRYAEWFKDRMKAEFLERMTKLAEVRKSKVEDIPESAVKTTLQRSVQVLKRHRDWHFRAQSTQAPASILITTLAAHAYKGDQNLFEAVAMIAEAMPRYIQRDEAGWCVQNPVQPEENFADQWRMEPKRQQIFMQWLDAVRRDLDEIRRSQGIPTISERMAKSFGEDVVRKSAARLGAGYKELRDLGRLGMGIGTGFLSTGTSSTRPVKSHAFYGAKDPEA